MFYRCKSCGGNVIYDPKKKAMVCESCGNGGEPDLISQEKKHVCNNCGAEIEADKIDLSLKCPYCGTYVIFEDRMENEYEPNLVLPFALDKHKALDLLKEKFAKQMFLPGNFCAASTIESMQGLYVPFWMYDLHTHVHFEGEADKVRTWDEDDYECTETSTYRILRDFDVDYDKIPVDASKVMPDKMMDLMEPYKYGELGDFDAKYLSGFQAEVYDEDKNTLLPRAKKKADGAYALALGFPLHLALSPFVTGSPVAVNVLTEGLKDLTGGQLIIETEVDAAAQKFDEIIKEKRAGLGIDSGINKGGDAIC